MSDQEKSTVGAGPEEVKEVDPEEVQDVSNSEKKKVVEKDGSKAGRVRTESGGYSITEEQEKTLLAGEDDEDLDVIELECLVKDFDSDMEEEFRRKDAKRVELKDQKATGTAKEAASSGKVEVLEVVRIVHTPELEEPLEGFEEKAPAPGDDDDDDDRDVIQIVVENADDLLEETPTGGKTAERPPEVSVHVSDVTENERILSKPLVKQVVMDVSGEGDEEDEIKDQDGDEGSPKDGEDDRAKTPIGSQEEEDSDAEQPLVIADSVEANVGAMSGRHQEDPDVLQLKLDLQQNMGKMDYEPDDDDHRDPMKDSRADDEEQLERRIQIKQEPMSPVKNRLERILLEIEDIPTIELSSEDDCEEAVLKMLKKAKKVKKKSKKKTKKRSKSECSVIEDDPVAVEEFIPAVGSTTSSKSLHSTDSLIMDEELTTAGYQLRKRKSGTRLDENGSPPPARKRRNPVSCRSSTGQFKSRGSIISDDIVPDKPAKKMPSQKSTFQPISTAERLKINSLFADCAKPEVVPKSILDDGRSLIDKVDENLFEKVFEPHQPAKKHAPPPLLLPRQTVLITALPMASSVLKGGHKSTSIEQPGTSKSAQKPKPVVPEVMHSLENDLALSSSDEDVSLQAKLASAKRRSPVPKKRKRGRASKHQIEDYFGPSPVRDTKDSQPTEETPVNDGKKPQVKRRKKRSRLGSSSEDETTATESLSLAATLSTITTTREEEDEEPLVQVEPEQPRTEEMRVVLSPLTDEKIEKLSKCNTPKKARAQSKATQTELEGLTWRIDLSQIDFHSEYFEKLYQLITNGRQLRNQTRRNSNNNFEGVVMVGRDAVLPPTPPERSPQRPPPPAAANGRARSDIERLLFERVDEVEFVTAARVDPAARERMERSVRANFRIPKITKQPSRSPQDVTSSTQHDNEDENRRSSSGSGYSNDRPVASDPRRHITIGGSRSPLRVENVRSSNRPEVAAPATVGGGDTARPLAPIRRTIQNDNVQQPQPTVAPPIAAQTQPIENGYPTYGPSEQRPPPQPQQYRVSSGVNMPQQQPQPLQQLGVYSASGPEVDIKPNISSLNNPVAMLGSGFMNPNRFFDSINLVCTLTMLQMQQQMQQQQQQLQFPAMSVPGQMFPGPSVVPTAAAVSNPAPAPPPPSSCAAPRFVGVPDGGGGQLDEVSDQISQIFGCIDSLKGRCIKNPCQYSHSLPAEADLRQILLGSAQDVVMTTYQFIVGQDHLFLRYFPVYTEVMGRRNMRHQLVDAVPHCEQSKRAFSHYRFIVDGLMINGTLTRSKAVQLVLDKHRKISFDQINVLISLILDTGDDIPQFLQWLEHFSQVQDYHFEIPSINRLLAFCVRSSRSANVLLHGTGADVAKLTYRLVMGVASGKEPFVDTDSLAEYAELLMKSNLGLDHEKILHKYRKNEMSSSAARH